MNFDTIEYLKSGTKKQRDAYEVLHKNKIIEGLSVFDPVLVGTIPLNIDIENSDLDIICFASDKSNFKKTVTANFKEYKNFNLYDSPEINSVTANFEINNFAIEIFGQPVAVRQQLAYRHMLIEYKLLKERGEVFRQQVIELKRKGIKTEPAFCILLGLSGDPYTELLKYE